MSTENFRIALPLVERLDAAGAIARLVLVWDPHPILHWVAGEVRHGVPPHDIATAVGEVCATAIYGTMDNMPPSVDRNSFLNGDLGILKQLEQRLNRRLNRRATPGGIILPDASSHGVGA